MRTLALALAAVAAAALVTGDAKGGELLRNYRLVRASDEKSKQHPPAPFTAGPQTCTPDLPGVADPPKTFEILGEGFDPAKFDEISVARSGSLLAYATNVSEMGLPGTSRQIVLLPEGPGETSMRITKVATDDDQPSVQFDDFGFRCVFRASAGAGGQAPSNIHLFTSTRHGDMPVTETIAVTELTGQLRAFDPSLATRVRTRDVGSGVKVKERDARVAFVSTGDHDAGENTAGREQLFVWEEAAKRFRQITRNTDDGGHVSRPSISKSGEVVAFESDADLVPDAVDPLDSSRVGNPNRVRQIYRWQLGRGVEQLTWSAEDCFSPRMDVRGRFILFSTRGDPIAGGNPEGNSEIFMWVARGQPQARLRQLTQTNEGDSVLPRPTARAGTFAFFSTAHPPLPYPGETVKHEFGEGPRECTAQALLWNRGRVTHIHGFFDTENAVRVAATPQKIPVLTGPPAPGSDGLRVFFATNDFHLSPPPARGPVTDAASPFAFFVAMATRYARR